MYKRLAILSAIILAAFCGLASLGYHSVRMWARGIEGERLGEFASVAEQIRRDVNRKLEQFMAREQNRPYTDYFYYHVPDNAVAVEQQLQQMPILRSPLAGRLDHGLAYGQFQIEPDGSIITPNDDVRLTSSAGPKNEFAEKVYDNRRNIELNLLPALARPGAGAVGLGFNEAARVFAKVPAKTGAKTAPRKQQQKKAPDPGAGYGVKGGNFPIPSLQKVEAPAQVVNRSRAQIQQDFISNTAVARRQAEQDPAESPAQPALAQDPQPSQARTQPQQRLDSPAAQAQQAAVQAANPRAPGDEMVQVLIEPFVPVLAPGPQDGESIFGGQVFMLRHVRIEDKHLIQGFLLNEKKLIEEVAESARRYIRPGMRFELAGEASEESAYTAILDFGFGTLALNLLETDPGWIGAKIREMRNWYFRIIAVVLVALALALVSLWHNTRAQLQLARKKDDFISAVSHELRTPLTSIRMYSEMLEKNWVKSKDRIIEYYRNMRAESERLSRLIENVLDFSRIQRGRKRYDFHLGDLNTAVEEVVAMMRPYAAQKGLAVKTELGEFGPSAFDRDAVTQIVVNLLDNAIKYAPNAADKTITLRTRREDGFVYIEVEDHGPGIPHRERRKIFEEFYRIGAEATRETTGTGLGLALVKRFAEAHDGFVEILSARPSGVIFRVALAARRPSMT